MNIDIKRFILKKEPKESEKASENPLKLTGNVEENGDLTAQNGEILLRIHFEKDPKKSGFFVNEKEVSPQKFLEGCTPYSDITVESGYRISSHIQKLNDLLKDLDPELSDYRYLLSKGLVKFSTGPIMNKSTKRASAIKALLPEINRLGLDEECLKVVLEGYVYDTYSGSRYWAGETPYQTAHEAVSMLVCYDMFVGQDKIFDDMDSFVSYVKGFVENPIYDYISIANNTYSAYERHAANMASLLELIKSYITADAEKNGLPFDMDKFIEYAIYGCTGMGYTDYQDFLKSWELVLCLQNDLGETLEWYPMNIPTLRKTLKIKKRLTDGLGPANAPQCLIDVIFGNTKKPDAGGSSFA